MAINRQNAYRIPNRLDHKRKSNHNIIIKKTSALRKERILEVVSGKTQGVCKDRPIRILPDFTTETIKAEKPGHRSCKH